MIDSYAALFSSMAMVQASDSMTALTYLVGSGLMSVLVPSWFNKTSVASVLYCSIYHCTSFKKNEIEKFGILICDDLFIRDFRIIPEGKICQYSVNNLNFIDIWQ